MKTYFRRVVALVLAAVIAFAAAAFTASADDYSNESLVLQTEFVKIIDGETYAVRKVEPGEEIKARIYVGTSYYTTAMDLMVFYDETFFEDSYESGVTEFSPTMNYESAQCSKMTAMMTKIDDSTKKITNLVNYGYLTQDFVDTHQAIIYAVNFSDSKAHMLSENDWIFEIDLKVRNDADGYGTFGFVYDTVQRVGTHERAAVNVYYNTADGTALDSISLANLDIPTTIYTATATTLEETFTTYPPETTPVVTTQAPTVAPESTAPVSQVTTTVVAEESTSESSELTTDAADETTAQVTVPASSDEYETTTFIPEASTTEESVYTTTAVQEITTGNAGEYTTYPNASTTNSQDSNITTAPYAATTYVTVPPATTQLPAPSHSATQVVPATTQGAEQTTALNISIGIRNPTEKVIKYGDGIILHAETSKTLPEGYSIVWEADNACFTMNPSENGDTCTIYPSESGYTKFTAKIVDENNNEIAVSGVREMQSKAGFFWKIIAFFKNLFGLTKVYPEFIK